MTSLRRNYPLCPYPQYAQCAGTGENIDTAANFTCGAPPALFFTLAREDAAFFAEIRANASAKAAASSRKVKSTRLSVRSR